MRNALNTLSKMRRTPQNPLLKRMQGASDEVRKKMVDKFESGRAQMLAEQREMLYGVEDENQLLAGERRRAELEQRTEVGKTASFLMKKGYSRIQANALAIAFTAEMNGLKEELTSQVGEAKTKQILKEMRENLFSIFKNPDNMSALIKDVRTHQKRFSQMILMQVRNEVFEKYGLPTE